MPSPITPLSRIIFLSGTGLVDYSNQRFFLSSASQEDYFMRKAVRMFENFRYIRQNNSVRVEMGIDALLALNIDYAMYKNENFSNSQWIYCFVVEMKYINDNTTEIFLEVDAWQTFRFKCSWEKCMVVREHTQQYKDNREIPANVLTNHTYPENLELGDYVVCATRTLDLAGDSYDMGVIIGCSADLNSKYGNEKNPTLTASTGGRVDGINSGLNFYYCKNIANLMGNLKTYPWICQCIQFAIQVPAYLIDEDSDGLDPVTDVPSIKKVKSSYSSENLKYVFSDTVFDKFPSYKNTKLYTYPYSFIEISNNAGQVIVLKPELLNDNNISLSVITYLGANPRMVAIVDDYAVFTDGGQNVPQLGMVKGEGLNMGLVYSDFPQVPVLTDNTLLYQAQNARTLQLNQNIAEYNKKESFYQGIIEGGASSLGNLLKGNLIGVVSSVYGGAKTIYEGQKNNEITIRKQLAKVKDSQLVSPTVTSLSGGDAFNMANHIFNITIKWKTIKPEYAQRLEEYFTRYGYLTNNIKYPMSAFHANQNFNYIQTEGCIITGDMPQEYSKIIESMFDNGVTFWHDLDSDIGQYDSNPRRT